MTIEKNHNGALIITDIVKGYLFKRIFYGYSKKDAIKLFKIAIKKEN